MKEKLLALWTKVVTTVQENKETVIRVGGVVAGVVIGAVATSIVASMQDEEYDDGLTELRILAEEGETEEVEE